MSGWKGTSSVRESTERVQIYLSDDRKQEWDEEAECRGFSSTSEYVLNTVQRARAEDQTQRHSYSSEETERLEEKVDQLQKRLREEKKQTAADTRLPSFYHMCKTGS